MADPASIAKMKALAEYFRNGGQIGTQTTDHFDPKDQNDLSGRISAAPSAGLPPVHTMPQQFLSDRTAPEMQGAGAGTLDEMAASRARQLQLNNLAAQSPQAEPDLSGYTDWKGPRQFQQLQKQLQAPARDMDVRQGIKPGEALSPEQEEAINKKLQDEDEDENTRGSTRDTGTSGGI